MQQEVALMVQKQDMKEQLASAGAELVSSTPEQMAQQIRSEVQRFTALAKKTQLELE